MKMWLLKFLFNKIMYHFAMYIRFKITYTIRYDVNGISRDFIVAAGENGFIVTAFPI